MHDESETPMPSITNEAGRVDVAGMPFDLLDAGKVETAIRNRDPNAPFAYVVTPNVDHVVRNHRRGLRHLYDAAWISVCDSQILAMLSPAVGVRFPSVITGSDLTKLLLDQYLVHGDHITIIGCSDKNITALRSKLPNVSIHHYNPPMGFINSKAEVEHAVIYALSHPSKFVFLAVGSPQQEQLALKLKERKATGLGLCIGASILFIIGAESRAPKWVQTLSLEWLYRLLQNPKRLWRRYLIDNPYILLLILKDLLAQRR